MDSHRYIAMGICRYMVESGNKANKIREATKQTVKVFKAYIIGIVLVYVAASILSSQNVIDVDSNQILIISATVIGVAVVLYQAYMVKVARKEKLAQ